MLCSAGTRFTASHNVYYVEFDRRPRLSEKAAVADVIRLAGRIKDNWSLCQLFEGQRRACEAEMMVAQTIHAAATNAQGDPAEPFSWKDPNVNYTGGGGLVDNATAYHMLLAKYYFVEEQRQHPDGDERTVIFPTRKLVSYLDGYFARPGLIREIGE